MPRNELRGDKASYSFSHDAVLVVCRPIIIVLRGRSLRKQLLLSARTTMALYSSDYLFGMWTTIGSYSEQLLLWVQTTIAVVLHLDHSLHLLEVVRCKVVLSASCEYLGAVVLSCSKSRKPEEDGKW